MATLNTILESSKSCVWLVNCTNRKDLNCRQKTEKCRFQEISKFIEIHLYVSNFVQGLIF